MFKNKINDNLSLKVLEHKDYEELFALTDQSRDYLMEWLPWLNSTTTPNDSLDFIKNSLQGYANNSSMDNFIIFNDKIVGVAGFNSINWNNKTGYIGYWLGKDYQGLGIMTNVTKTLIDYAFYDLKLNKVEIRVASENKKSSHIPERLNFKNEGCIRQAEWLYNHYVDHIVYGMLKSDWQKNSQ